MNLLTLLLAVLAHLKDLVPFPNFSDEDETHEWVKKLGVVLRSLAAKTETTLDDQIINVLDTILADDDAFHSLWMLLEHFSETGNIDEQMIRVLEKKIDPTKLKILLDVLLAILGIFL